GVGGKVHHLLSYPIGICMAIFFLLKGVDLNMIDLLIISMVGIEMSIVTLRTHLSQKVYKTEKISSILPYTNLNKILIIIFSFFLFNDVSILSLLITLAAVCFIIIFSIDFENHCVPRNIIPIVSIEFLRTSTALMSGWVIINYTEIHYFLAIIFWGTLILSTLSIKLGEFKSIPWKNKRFWTYRYMGSLEWVSFFLVITIIKNLGLSMSVLLSFLGIGASLIFAYIFTKDVPAKKDIILTIIVSGLVGLGFYFK
ncbi:hypothetical protein OAN96_01515, partial [Candidatus Gracilibacteria bacterium]|nr:hypothetical protein [Candidatus Gracilibacteria bacterium]